MYTKENALKRYPEGKKDRTFTIPKNVKAIANNAFYNGVSLESVKIPFGVTSIGKNGNSEKREENR